MSRKTLRVHPSVIRSRKTRSFDVDVADTQGSREAGFQNVSVFDAVRPLLLEWEFSATRILHNKNVEFNLLACCLDHEGTVVQAIKLDANSRDMTMTLPCRYILEIPEMVEDIIVQAGDQILFG